MKILFKNKWITLLAFPLVLVSLKSRKKEYLNIQKNIYLIIIFSFELLNILKYKI